MQLEIDDSQTFNTPILKSITNNFVEELSQAQAGGESSLPYIIHELPAKPLIKDNEVFQVMVIGGSVFRTALVKFEDGKLVFLNDISSELPIFKTKNELLFFVEKYLDANIRIAALNFAYPLRPIFANGKLDGILLSGAKEHTFTGLTGQRVGGELEEYFRNKYKRAILFAVANDTICLTLSGKESADRDNLAGGIVGTGVNFAYFIDPKHIVNLESRNFDKFPLSTEVKNIVKNSTSAGEGIFGKETSGAYLYQHFNYIIHKKGIDYPPIYSTKELNDVAVRDNSKVSLIARDLLKKSAAMIAVQIAGITLFKGHDMTFVMEGSLFWKAKNYKEDVEHFLGVLIPDFYVNFVHYHDSPLAGAAELVM